MKAEDARRDFYVYALLREDGVTPFYIGKGRGRRVKYHSMPFELAKPSFKSRVARKVIAACGRIPHEIFHAGLSEFEAHEREQEAIICLGRRGRDRGGILTNATDGGDGVSGMKQPAEAKKKIANSARGRRHRPETLEKISKANVGRVFSPETKARMAAAAARRWANPEQRLSLSVAMTGKKASPETRQKMSEAHSGKAGRPHTEESRAAISAARRKVKVAA